MMNGIRVTVQAIRPKSGQESVWDYPRPPLLQSSFRRVRVIFKGVTIADSIRAYRVLETSHPPAWYIPPADIHLDSLIEGPGSSFCEFKGRAVYWDLQIGTGKSARAAWSYPSPSAAFASIKGYLCFYPSRVDACFLDDEQVQPQAGDFYGGWITSDIVGPFKGGPGTWGW